MRCLQTASSTSIGLGRTSFPIVPTTLWYHLSTYPMHHDRCRRVIGTLYGFLAHAAAWTQTTLRCLKQCRRLTSDTVGYVSLDSLLRFRSICRQVRRILVHVDVPCRRREASRKSSTREKPTTPPVWHNFVDKHRTSSDTSLHSPCYGFVVFVDRSDTSGSMSTSYSRINSVVTQSHATKY